MTGNSTPTSFLAMQLMSASAKNASAALDTLSTWMLAGFGAVLGLTLSQMQGLAPFLDTDHVRFAGGAYLAAVVPALFAKFLASMLLVAGIGADQGRDIGEKMDAQGLEIDAEQLYAEIEQGTQWPMTWFNRRAMRLAIAGDLAGMGRLARDRVTIQLRLVLLQTLLTVIAGLILVSGIH